MATLKQIGANRFDARKSGIDPKALTITGEKAADLEALAAEYLDHYRPAGPVERAYVDILIRDDWQLRRLARADAQIWEHKAETMYSLDKDNRFGQIYESGKAVFERLQRRINAVERSFKQALHELERLQANRPGPPGGAGPRPAQPAIGFVPSPAPDPPGEAVPQPPQPLIGFVPPAPESPAGPGALRYHCPRSGNEPHNRNSGPSWPGN